LTGKSITICFAAAYRTKFVPIKSSLQKKIFSYILLILLVLSLGNLLAFGPSWSSVFLILQSLAVLILVYVLMNYLITLPLQQVLNGVREFRHGKHSQELQSKRLDEIGSLAQECNRQILEIKRLREELADFNEALERKVGQRTAILKRVINHLQKKMNTESLSGLANRRYFDEYSQMLFEHARKNGQDLTCLMIDVDNFKQVNDCWGHSVGDMIIVFLGELLKAFTRLGDLCARYGGDEFVVLLNKCSREETEKIAERIRMHFAREVYRFAENTSQKKSKTNGSGNENPAGDNENGLGRDFEPRLSIGIAILKEGNVSKVSDLMKMADEALYQAKQAGRNCVMLYA